MLTNVQPQTFQNAVLRRLTVDCIERLRLKPVKLEAERRIATSEDPAQWLLFIESGSVALSMPLRDGSAIDTGILGNGSIVCATALLGTRETLHQAMVRSPGHGFVCSIERGLLEFGRAGEFQRLVLACLHAQFMQASQIAVCNLRHDVQQRLCRWMLHCQNASAGQHIHATHETLAEALGVRRTTVTLTMQLLRNEDVIEYSRGCIRLTDRAALESRSCECYEALRDFSETARFIQCEAGGKIGPQAVRASMQGAGRIPSYDLDRQAESRPQYHVQ